jgi:hypothetical protein
MIEMKGFGFDFVQVIAPGEKSPPESCEQLLAQYAVGDFGLLDQRHAAGPLTG